jgi:diaminopimelate epimerase
MKVTFYKYQGTGNDFIVVDNRENNVLLTSRQVKHLCNRRFGIGADGLMLLNLKKGYDFDMVYYNADGNESSMCGNGGRCLVKFAYELGMRKSTYFFSAVDGDHEATIDENGWVYLKMKDVFGIKQHYADRIVDTGSPHYVKSISDLRSYDVVKAGRDIRYSNGFKREGINVNFVEGDRKGIFVRTYERGVEDETLSCGTGVTAAALVYAHNDNGFNHVAVKTLGGSLAVEFEKTGEKEFKNIWLCGPAEFVFKGEIVIEELG